MVNYTNSKVYKIWSTQGDKIYIGSTTKQYLSQRMDKHRTDYKRWKDGKCNLITSFRIFDEYGVENCSIELLEAKECKTKDELHQIEGKYIRDLECVNKVLYPYRTKEQLMEYQQTYRNNNKRIASTYMKEYRQDNKQKILELNKSYYESHKQKILEQQKQILTCECGKTITHGYKSQHIKSIKHCQFIESKLTKPEVDEV